MRHEERLFWGKLRDSAVDILNIISTLSKKSFFAVTLLEENRTWWSDRAVEFFGMPSNYITFSSEVPKITVHEEDYQLYRQGMLDRYQGMFDSIPLMYRIKTGENEYSIFEAVCKNIYDESGKRIAFITLIDNHGIADEVDAVTGLHNGVVFNRFLENRMELHKSGSILKIGIDKFSHINVIYGAVYANRVLSIVAKQVQGILQKGEYIFRFPGAKFGIVLESTDRDRLAELYQEIVHMINHDIVIEQKKILLKISGGAIIYDQEERSVDVIKSKLTYALNRSKTVKHGELSIYNDEMMSNSLAVISTIHQCAVDKCQGFYLCYQPIVNASTGTIKGIEALVRWEMEPYGQVMPGFFIDWLENDPAMYELGNWILEQAISDAKELQSMIPGLFVNVNISSAQLERKEFRNNVLNILSKYQFPHQKLCMELTERCRELEVDFLRQEISFFKSQGIKVAMDDFGTGTSSLQVALDLPVDELKIDMSFIKDIQNKPANQAMVQSILEFAKQTNLETCIEGVENEAVRDYLKQFDATWHQGYYYAKPIRKKDLEKIIEKSKEKSQ